MMTLKGLHPSLLSRQKHGPAHVVFPLTLVADRVASCQGESRIHVMSELSVDEDSDRM